MISELQSKSESFSKSHNSTDSAEFIKAKRALDISLQVVCVQVALIDTYSNLKSKDYF
jgi:hypothetical protein